MMAQWKRIWVMVGIGLWLQLFEADFQRTTSFDGSQSATDVCQLVLFTRSHFLAGNKRLIRRRLTILRPETYKSAQVIGACSWRVCLARCHCFQLDKSLDGFSGTFAALRRDFIKAVARIDPGQDQVKLCPPKLKPASPPSTSPRTEMLMQSESSTSPSQPTSLNPITPSGGIYSRDYAKSLNSDLGDEMPSQDVDVTTKQSPTAWPPLEITTLNPWVEADQSRWPPIAAWNEVVDKEEEYEVEAHKFIPDSTTLVTEDWPTLAITLPTSATEAAVKEDSPWLSEVSSKEHVSSNWTGNRDLSPLAQDLNAQVELPSSDPVATSQGEDLPMMDETNMTRIIDSVDEEEISPAAGDFVVASGSSEFSDGQNQAFLSTSAPWTMSSTASSSTVETGLTTDNNEVELEVRDSTWSSSDSLDWVAHEASVGRLLSISTTTPTGLTTSTNEVQLEEVGDPLSPDSLNGDTAGGGPLKVPHSSLRSLNGHQQVEDLSLSDEFELITRNSVTLESPGGGAIDGGTQNATAQGLVNGHHHGTNSCTTKAELTIDDRAAELEALDSTQSSSESPAWGTADRARGPLKVAHDSLDGLDVNDWHANMEKKQENTPTLMLPHQSSMTGANVVVDDVDSQELGDKAGNRKDMSLSLSHQRGSYDGGGFQSNELHANSNGDLESEGEGQDDRRHFVVANEKLVETTASSSGSSRPTNGDELVPAEGAQSRQAHHNERIIIVPQDSVSSRAPESTQGVPVFVRTESEAETQLGTHNLGSALKRLYHTTFDHPEITTIFLCTTTLVTLAFSLAVVCFCARRAKRRYSVDLIPSGEDNSGLCDVEAVRVRLLPQS